MNSTISSSANDVKDLTKPQRSLLAPETSTQNFGFWLETSKKERLEELLQTPKRQEEVFWSEYNGVSYGHCRMPEGKMGSLRAGFLLGRYDLKTLRLGATSDLDIDFPAIRIKSENIWILPNPESIDLRRYNKQHPKLKRLDSVTYSLPTSENDDVKFVFDPIKHLSIPKGTPTVFVSNQLLNRYILIDEVEGSFAHFSMEEYISRKRKKPFSGKKPLVVYA